MRTLFYFDEKGDIDPHTKDILQAYHQEHGLTWDFETATIEEINGAIEKINKEFEEFDQDEGGWVFELDTGAH